MLKTRLIVGSILVILIAGILALDHFTHTTYGFTALLFIITALALYEFYTMHEKKHGIKLPKIYGIVIGLLLFSYWWYSHNYQKLYFVNDFLFIFLAIGGLIVWYLLRAKPEGMSYLYIILFGICYISLPVLFIYNLRIDHHLGETIFLFFLIINKGADTGAYFGGTLLGRHKLAPKVSPNKTVEGLISALITGVLIGFLFHYFTDLATYYYLGYFLLAAFLITASGQIGDLVMSLIKRYCGVKHSSNLLSSHGGVLDLIDSLLVSGPIAYLMLCLYLKL